jgi:AcrR family transcriptional regulator
MPLRLYDKNQILDACYSVFARRGYKDTTTATLAEAAGISKALLFHHFNSKKELYVHVLDRFFERARVEIANDILSDETGFFEAREKLSIKKLDYYRKNHEAYAFLKEAFFQTPDELAPELKEKYRRIMADREKELERLFEKVPLRDGVDRKQAFQLVMLVLDSFDDRYLSAVSERDALDEVTLSGFLKKRNDFLDMVRYGIEKQLGRQLYE